MLLCKRQNYHRSKLPPPGAVGHIVGLSAVNPHRKCIGIHTVWVRFWDDSSIQHFNGLWFEELS